MSAPVTVVEPTLLTDPLVTGIPVVEDGSELVDLTAVGVRVRQASPALPPGLALPASSAPPAAAPGTRTHRLVRRTLAERLGEADALLPDGLRLLVVEGLRPLTVQRTIHAAYRSRIAAERPGLDPAELDR